MNTLKTTNSNTASTILNFIKNLLPVTLYKAINFVLTPCCTTPSVAGITLTNLTINGVSQANKQVKIIIISQNTPFDAGQAVITLYNTGGGSI